MSRRLPISVYKKINTQCFKSNPYIPKKESGDKFIYKNITETNTLSHNTLNLTTHPSVKLHPAIKYSLISNKLLTKLNEIQESSYLSIVSGKDVTIHSPTGQNNKINSHLGTGKTIAYLLPIINNVYYIHDMLENLMFKNELNTLNNDFSLQNLTLGRTKRLGHSMFPSFIDNYRQDLDDLESLGKSIFEKYKEGTTIEKLLEAVYLNDPKKLKLLGVPTVPMRVWKKRSKNSIYRNIMSNPLGSVRSVVILVPNKDLVSQVISYIDKIDILGRLSVQTLANIPSIPSDTTDSHSQMNSINIENVENVVNDEKSGIKNEKGSDLGKDESERTRFYEDELKMIESVPVKEIGEREIETRAMNMGNRVNRIRIKVPENANEYSIDGLIPETVTYKKQPILISDTIQWGSVDVVVTTVQSFVFELLSSATRRVYPISVIFDEVDMLFENNASRSSVLEIISRLRPRPLSYNPLTDVRKKTSKTPPPVQIINVGSTINFGGVQTSGSMIFQRFNTSKLVFGQDNHVINSDLHFVTCEEGTKLDCLVKLIVNNPVKKTLIYCNSLKNCGIIYNLLKKHDWPVLSFHSKSALSTRLAILKTFRDEEPAILVATDLVTRGINLSANHIINFDFPTSSSVFFHRIKTPNAKVTNIITQDSELSEEIKQCNIDKRPINQTLSRKRSFRKRLERLKFQTMESKCAKSENLASKNSESSFFKSRLVINRKVNGDVKYRRIPIKKRLISLFNNFN